MIVTWLNKILNVRPGEWPRLLLLSLILVLANVAVVWGITIAFAGFLVQEDPQIGLQMLAWVTLLSAILSVPALLLYTVITDRIDNNRLFAYIFLAGGAITLLSIILLGFNLPYLAYPFFYVLIMTWISILNPHIFTYINDFYDIQEMKRTLPIILALGRFGAAMAGFFLQFIIKVLSNQIILAICLVIIVGLFGIVIAVPYIFKEQRKTAPVGSATNSAQKGGDSYLQSIKDGLVLTLQSVFLRWIAIGTLALLVLMTLAQYRANQIMLNDATFAANYAGYLGILDGVSNLVALLLLLFGINRATKAWGVGNTSLIFPVGNLLVGFGLAFFKSIPSALVAEVDRRGLWSVQASVDALLYNALPLRTKARARAFIGGLVVPLGTIFGVVLLLLELSYGKQISWMLPTLIVLATIFYLISAFVVRNQYSQALIKMLEEEDYSFLLNEGDSQLVVADPTTLNRLQQKLNESSSHEMRIFMTQLIAQVGGIESLTVLVPAIKGTEDARTRAAMLNVLTASGVRGTKVQKLYMDFLSDPDAQVRQASASGLEQLLGVKDAWLQSQLLNLANDEDSQVSLYALQSLANTGEFYRFTPAVEKLEHLIVSNSIELKKNAIDVLGKIARPPATEQLLTFLTNENDQLRLEAMLKLERLGIPFGNDLDQKILERTRLLCHDPVASIRQAALRVLGKYKVKIDHPLFISVLGDENPQVRATAVDVLVSIGRGVVDTLQTQLKSADVRTRKAATVTLSRINPQQFGGLVDSEVSDSLGKIYQNVNMLQALSQYEKLPSVRVLVAGLRENNEALLNEILYLLSAIHAQETLNIVKESLASDSANTRTVAVEALETLTSPKVASLIASLSDPALAPEHLLKLGRESFNIEQLDTITAFEKLITQSESGILIQLAIQALTEANSIGSSKSPQKPPSNPASKAARLLMTLETPSSQKETSSSSIQEAGLSPVRLTSILEKALGNSDPEVRQFAQIAIEKINNQDHAVSDQERARTKLERIILLKETSFFRNVPVYQLETLAKIAQEKHYQSGSCIFKQGDPGGALYIILQGLVHLQQEKRAGELVLAELKPNSYFGEMSLFDDSLRSASAIVKEEAQVLEVRKEPIVTLIMQYPDLALELINVLSQRMRETSDRMAEAARSRPRELHKLFDQFD